MTESEAGRHLDEMIGFTQMKPKPKPAPPEKPKFPDKALSFGVGKAPQIPSGPVE